MTREPAEESGSRRRRGLLGVDWLRSRVRARSRRLPWLRPLAWVLHWELATLVLVVAASTALWGFAEIADEVVEGETREFDRAVLLAMRSAEDTSDPVGPGWFEEAGRDLTALGGMATLVLVTLLTACFLGLQRKHRAALFVIVAVAGGVAASSLLKIGFDRPRPDLVPHGMRVYTHSFPSGHSMLSAVTYLTLGAILARTQEARRLKLFIVGAALLTTALVGASRVYLGVHWPTDVLAGWSAGALWACLCWLVARALQVFGRVEGEEPAPAETLREQRPRAE